MNSSFTVSADPKKPFRQELPQHHPVKNKHLQRGAAQLLWAPTPQSGQLLRGVSVTCRDPRPPNLDGPLHHSPSLSFSVSLSLGAPVVTKARRVLNCQWKPPYFNALPCWDLAPALGTEMVLLLRVTSNCRCGDGGLNIQVLCVCVCVFSSLSVKYLLLQCCSEGGSKNSGLWSNRF